MNRRLWLATAILAMAIPAAAQTKDPGNEAHWGASFDFTVWQAMDRLKIVFDDPASMSVRGTEFRVGLAHGSDYGGNTEFVYVRKALKDGSTVDRGHEQQCFGSFGCFQSSGVYTAQGAYLDGFEVNKYLPFVTIQKRAQVGLTIGGGIGFVKGNARFDETFPQIVTDSRGFAIGMKQMSRSTTVPATDMIIENLKYLPLANVEVTGGVILRPGLKLKAGGGFNFPGVSRFSVGVVYLFGAH